MKKGFGAESIEVNRAIQYSAMITNIGVFNDMFVFYGTPYKYDVYQKKKMTIYDLNYTIKLAALDDKKEIMKNESVMTFSFKRHKYTLRCQDVKRISSFLLSFCKGYNYLMLACSVLHSIQGQKSELRSTVNLRSERGKINLYPRL